LQGREYQQPPVSGVGGSSTTSAAAPGAKSSEAASTRLQIRLPSGEPVVLSMSSGSSMYELFVIMTFGNDVISSSTRSGIAS
jgi:hypothetical protein